MATGHRRMAAALAIAFGAVMMTASTASAASFTITKKTEPAGDPASFNFTWEGVKQGDPNASMGSGDFTLTDGQSQTITTAVPGFYTVKEQTPSGWKLVDISCGELLYDRPAQGERRKHAGHQRGSHDVWRKCRAPW